ncbi:hypothetical protein IWX78_000249 [Mycetocola sp. CAN_C7]|uniref:DUF3054 domain-containing protein n=1 Tax=Mycetocola sp. CAN_C7 TaxID=2787724 RepID=UPI0018CA2E14
MSASPTWVVRVLGIDLLATLVFAIIGRASHHKGFTIVGLLETWWPFAAALTLGWLVTLAWRQPFGTVWPGLGLWVVAVVGGMLLRTFSGQGTAVPFVVVAALSLALMLLGWRVILAIVLRRRATARSDRRRETERYS